MALFLSTICAIPTVIGTAEAVSAQKKEDAIMKHKAKFFMTVDFSIGKEPPKEAQVVLKDNKVCKYFCYDFFIFVNSYTP
jgi:hypothetical protein